LKYYNKECLKYKLPNEYQLSKSTMLQKLKSLNEYNLIELKMNKKNDFDIVLNVSINDVRITIKDIEFLNNLF
jgi:hypothetical protein